MVCDKCHPAAASYSLTPSLLKSRVNVSDTTHAKNFIPIERPQFLTIGLNECERKCGGAELS